MRVAGSVLACVMVLATNAVAQETGSVVPDAGTGMVRGHVVSAVDRRPLARALVTLASESTGWRRVVTDEGGAFEIPDVPTGRYELRAALTGYLTLAYGQSHPSDAPRLIDIKRGRVRSGLEIALPTSGVIEVRVTDESGIPIEGAYVQAQRRRRSTTGELELAPNMGDTQGQFGSDDHGVIRLYDLPAGEYYVSATPSSVRGRPNDLQHQRATGRLKTFHPGVVDLSSAEPVVLGVGEEISLNLVIAKPFTAVLREPNGVITVHVTDDLGNPTAGIEVRALEVTGEGAHRKTVRAKSTAINVSRGWQKKDFFTDDHGDARIYDLPPGDYVVVADPTAPIYFPGSSSLAGAHAISIRPWDDVALEITLNVARATRQISGRVVRWDGEPGRTSVVLARDPKGPLYPFGFIDDTIGRAELVDGEFAFHDVLPGDYIIRTSYPDNPDGVAEVLVTVDEGDISDLILTTVRVRSARASRIDAAKAQAAGQGSNVVPEVPAVD